METKTIRAAIAAICVAAAAVSSWAAEKSAVLTCSGYTGTTTLTGFQALVKLSDGVNGFNYADCAANDGTDLWFTDSSGNLIPHEVDTWNTSGDSFVWVRIPSLTPASAGFARITMHWGETRTAEQTCVTEDTWDGFVGVWHMGHASGTANEPDATGNGLNAVPTVANGSCNLSQMTANADGVVGGSRVNQTSTGDNNNPGLKVPDYTSKITDCTKFSVGGWFRASGKVNYYARLLAQRHYQTSRKTIVQGWEVELSSNSSTVLSSVRGGSSTAVQNTSLPDIVNGWDYVYVTYNGTTATIYVNGVAAKSGTVTACPTSNYGFFIGAMGNYGIGWYGKYDEVRMYNGVQSADRIKADYDTMHSPSSFLTPAAKQVTLSCSGYAGTTTLTGFQSLVKLSDGVNGFRYGDCAANDGSDLWFTDSSGNLIPHEVDTWNTSGDSYVWVRIPTLKPVTEGATSITMHWGETRTAEQTCVTEDTWNGFVGVWHMGHASGTENEPDATGNGLHAVPTVANGSCDLSQMTANANGVVGGSRVNQTTTTDNNNPGLKVPDYSAKITDRTKFSVGGWFRATGTVNYFPRLLAQTHYATSRRTLQNLWEIHMGSGNPGSVTSIAAVRGSSGTSFAAASIPNLIDEWGYVYVTYDGTTATVYVNGVAAQSGSITACAASNYGFFIGAMGNYGIGWYGRYDEVRMFNGVQSADRIKADYDTMHSPDTFWSEFSAEPDPSTVYAATWTGNANNGAVANAANWRCTNCNGDVLDNALPTEDTLVFIDGNNVNIQIPVGQTLAGKTINIRNGGLGADCDWRGLDLDAVLIGALDLNGHNLYTKGFGGTVTITSTAPIAEGANELHVDVGDNDTWNNDSIAIMGSVKLVKDGNGTYVAGKADQAYGGGTEISAGVLKIGVNGVYYPLGAYNTRVYVATTNAVLDVNGQINFNNHEFVLNGGILRNTGANVSGGAGQFKTIRLATNSFFKVSNNWGFIGNGWAATELNLAGHELDMEIHSGHYFFLANTAISAGRIRVHGYGNGAGSLQTGNSNTSSSYAGSKGENAAPNTDLIVEVPLSIYAPLTVHDYIANYSGAATGNGGTAALKVRGTFKPSAHDFFYGCTMQDGSTIDLSARTSALPSVSSFTSGKANLEFAENATVAVKLGDRKVSSRTPVISWPAATKPTNVDTVTFVRGDVDSHYSLVVKDDGLYALKGFVIIVK